MLKKYLLQEYLEQMSIEIPYVGGMFPKGRLSLVVADGSVGKTELLIQTSLAITENISVLPIVNNYCSDNEMVMVIETENRKFDLIKRLVDVKANLNKYYFPKSLNENINANDPADLTTLSQHLTDNKTGLIIVDSLLGLNPEVDENKEEASKVLNYLAFLAAQYNVAVVCTQYLNKTQISSKISTGNIRGHSSIPQLAQLIWAIDKEDSQIRRLYQIKNNLNNLDDTIYKWTIENNRLKFLLTNNATTNTKDVRNKMYLANIEKNDKDIAKLIHEIEPEQQLVNLVAWVKRKRKK